MGNLVADDRPHRPGRMPEPVESAVHFGVKVRGSRKYGLRLSRDSYARINKKSSGGRWSREIDPTLWDALDEIYEDEDHRIYTDAWCVKQQIDALANFDLNMAYFASLDHDEFEASLQKAVRSQRGMVEVTDLTTWAGKPGLYIMVLDNYSQVYVGATEHAGGVAARVRQHWVGTKPFDRLVWGSVDTSILSIDSFRALDTTRIFAAKTTSAFERESKLLDSIPPKFVLNRIVGGRDAAKVAALFGVKTVMKQRDLAPLAVSEPAMTLDHGSDPST